MFELVNIEKDLKDITTKLEEHLKQYYDKFNENSIRYKKKYDVEPNFLYEPTLATSCSRIIFEKIDSSHINAFYATEFYLPLGISEKEIKNLEKEIDGNTIDNKYKMYIDAYIFDGKTDIFIEYKLKEKFNFTFLARDYLKFKIATYKNKTQSIFLYFNILKKKDGTASLKHGDNPVKLNNIVKKESIKKAYVYYYINLEDQLEINDKKVSLDETVDMYKNINSLTENIEITETLLNYKVTERDNDLLSYINMFKPHVIESKNIQRNYAFIKEFYEKVMEINNNKICGFDIDEIDSYKKILNYEKNYFIFFIDNAFKKRKTSAASSGLKSNIDVSLSIISMIEWYCKKRSIKLTNKSQIIDKQIGKGKGKTVIKGTNISKQNIEVFETYYNEETFEKAALLIEQVVYYIIEAYKILFIIKDDKIVGESDKAKYISYYKKINNLIKEITKELGIKEVKYIKEDISNYEETISSINDEIFNLIIKKY